MIAGPVRAISLSAALVLAGPGTSAARAPVALRAAPARVTLVGSTQETIRVTNSGTRRVVVDVTRAGFGLDLRGRPRIVARGARSAARWLVFRPGRLTLKAGGSAALVVASRLPPQAPPGDHDALVLLTTRPHPRTGVAVRMRMGIVVVVRAPGKVVRRLVLGPLRMVRRGRARLLELVVANRGNVTELLGGAELLVSLSRDGRPFVRLPADRRTFRPRTRGLVQFRYRGPRRGWVSARVVIAGEGDRRAVRRIYRIRL